PGKPCSRSQAAAFGSIRSRAKSRARPCVSRCSALSSKSTALVVVVEAASRLAAEAAGLDELTQQRAGCVLRVSEARVQHLHDRNARVEADQVGEGERPDRMVEAELRDRVDRFRV